MEDMIPVAIFAVMVVFIALVIILAVNAPCNPIPVKSLVNPTNGTFRQAPKGYVCRQ
ncbi:MAG: hypothetical protein ABSE71_04940 [Candidatus Micrarchaeaceae archaeon]|jgi:hypothetical protein|nr:hypothetical protein [Candidatus Micrarchaeota archaeon]HII09688.1 hypothetical protein [Candidatus Micrarchaeota archaeon]